MVVWAGFVASVMAAAVFWVFRSFEWTRFSPGTQIGCLLFDEPGRPLTETVGFALFMIACSTVVAALYAWIMARTGGPGWGGGALLGALHGAAVTAALPLLGRVNRCVKAGRMLPPGRLGLAWGRATPVALVVGHAVYGGILGAILAAA